MKKIPLLFLLLASVSFAAPSKPEPDWKQVAEALRSQRDSAVQLFMDQQITLLQDQKEIEALKAQVAALQPKPSPQPATATKK